MFSYYYHMRALLPKFYSVRAQNVGPFPHHNDASNKILLVAINLLVSAILIFKNVDIPTDAREHGPTDNGSCLILLPHIVGLRLRLAKSFCEKRFILQY